jgi:hypothetical protein
VPFVAKEVCRQAYTPESAFASCFFASVHHNRVRGTPAAVKAVPKVARTQDLLGISGLSTDFRDLTKMMHNGKIPW